MPLLNVNSLVTSFNVGPLTVTRRSPPTQNQYGGYEPGAANVFQINPVAVHNMTGRDLQQVPEADRNIETIKIYTKVRLYVADGGQAADVLTYQGRNFRIVQVADFDPQGAVYISLGQLQDVQVAA